MNTLNTQFALPTIGQEATITSGNTPETGFFKPNLSDCQTIADAIAEENKGNEHMIFKTPEELYQDFSNSGGFVYKDSGKLVGSIKLMVAEKIGDDKNNWIYERGGLMVLPEFRNQGFGSRLIEEALSRYQHLAMLSVTNVATVVHCCTRNNQVKIPRGDMSDWFKGIVDGPQEPCEGDTVFCNSTLLERYPFVLMSHLEEKK